jgi:hypothetical protein
MDNVWDSTGEELAETLLPGLPFVLVLTTEGAAVLMGKRSLGEAAGRAAERSVTSGVSMAAGALAAVAGAGLFSLPVAVLTRVGIGRARLLHQLESKVRADHLQLAILASSEGYEPQAPR